jgi:deferrochelatase/peroxidase EfeB
LHGEADPVTKEHVAARLIGRHKNGEPLVPRAENSTKKTERNDFLYSHEDGSGLACPIGAHIRRANPRDAIGPDPDTALRLSKMHRIIRRGRPYGARRDPKEGKSSGNGSRRGIAFIALNADIAGQFEMIQHSWLNNAHFGGLYAGTDPIGHVAQAGDEFAVQQRPANLHIERPRPFVTVRGGAYFFLPGINAVRALAD